MQVACDSWQLVIHGIGWIVDRLHDISACLKNCHTEHSPAVLHAATASHHVDGNEYLDLDLGGSTMGQQARDCALLRLSRMCLIPVQVHTYLNAHTILIGYHPSFHAFTTYAITEAWRDPNIP